MKLYYATGACSLTIRIFIEELHLTAEYIKVDLAKKQTENGLDFMKINPKGSVPALQLDSGLVLTENAAILQYLADMNDATQFLPPIKDIKRYQVLEWLNFVSAELHKSFAPFFSSIIQEQVKKDIFSPLLTKKLDFLNQHLANKQFLVLDQFTIADCYCFVVLSWAKFIHFSLSDWPHINAYFKQLSQRKSIQAAFNAEGVTA